MKQEAVPEMLETAFFIALIFEITNQRTYFREYTDLDRSKSKYIKGLAFTISRLVY